MLFASAVLPTWLLARSLALPRFAALSRAAFSVAVPWTVIAGFVVTESAAYPAALWAVLAVERAVALRRRPATWSRSRRSRSRRSRGRSWSLLATAVEAGLIRSNPASGLRIVKLASAPVEDGAERVKPLTEDELRALSRRRRTSDGRS